MTSTSLVCPANLWPLGGVARRLTTIPLSCVNLPSPGLATEPPAIALMPRPYWNRRKYLKLGYYGTVAVHADGGGIPETDDSAYIAALVDKAIALIGHGHQADQRPRPIGVSSLARVLTSPPSVVEIVGLYSVISGTSSPTHPTKPALRASAVANEMKSTLFFTFSPPLPESRSWGFLPPHFLLTAASSGRDRFDHRRGSRCS
jgi:hypothetical protein